MERNVKLNIDMDRLENVNKSEFQQAIGYLSSWGISRFNKANISNDGINDLIAEYSNREREGRFVIGAVWREHEQEYTFHS